MRFPSPLPGFLLLPVLLQGAPPVQSPRAEWLTYSTAHYRIHCPRAFEAFGQDVASRVEGIHAQYLGLVGYVYEKPIDILILDPVMEANGMAFPLFQRPFVVLWKTEPEPDSAIGHHRGWAELLVAHELGHMHHLLRPSRKPGLWERWTAVLGPVTRKSPRWVIEGYATLIEGRLTGSGRPHSAFRASVLRQWAIEGRLPSYEAMSGTGGFLGGSMAYLGGSAYLEWLETRTSNPKVFQDLWTRLAGKRDFNGAFTATFGFGAKEGYQRFCAELIHTALELERRARAQGLREGEVVTQLKGWVTDLALSPDGTKLLARVLDPKKPGLYVWDLKAKAAKPEVKDPDEPPDHPPLAPIRPPTHRLGRVHGVLPWKPRWTSSTTVAYQLRLPDSEGVLKPNPRTWSLGGAEGPTAVPPKVETRAIPSWKELDGIWNVVDGEGRPLTRTLAAAWNPVATPDGQALYYTQLSATGLQIRRLDLSLPPLDGKALPQDPAPLVKDLVLPKADEPGPLPVPVPVAPHPYRVGESHEVMSLAGFSNTPSSISYQIGAGGNDLLGRLNWQVLAGLGNGTGPRGALLGAAWRGWTWAPSLQLFSSLEYPSHQDFVAVQGFDRERRGAELALEFQDLGRPTYHLRPAVAFERVVPIGGAAQTRSLAGGVASMEGQWSLDGHGFHGSTSLSAYQGRTDGQAWDLTRWILTAGWLNPWVPVTFHAELGGLGGNPTIFDRFHLGGVPTSLLPSTLDANRVVQAALPAYTLQGDGLRRLRGELGLGFLTAYLEHATVWDHATPRPAAQRVAGLELDSGRLSLPTDVLRRLAGNLSFTLGIHRPLDGIMKDRTVGTLSVILRP
ncbi:MAG: hypothetical protein IPP58_13960 [Holophagaceae bacterium]|uniref:Uncharacterized protein n=1 Tax=Candidatus Geothrix skivensis TaxID=2954439 RepID=A0A9D7XMK5_9BACT|nr:hypothetical protein [Candidatus Geothrix skivensis]